LVNAVAFLRALVALLSFAPFAVSLWFLVQALRQRRTERLRWQVLGLLVNLLWAVGFLSLLVFPPRGAAWLGALPFSAASAAGIWLTVAESKAAKASGRLQD
jgi:hypothetical protein